MVTILPINRVSVTMIQIVMLKKPSQEPHKQVSILALMLKMSKERTKSFFFVFVRPFYRKAQTNQIELEHVPFNVNNVEI